MNYGYVRVSTREQNEERQMQQMREYIDDDRRIMVDKASGKDFKRTSYRLLTGTSESAALLREGDTLYISSIDRLGRNYEEIRKEWQKITKELKVNIIVLDMPILSTNENNLDMKFLSDMVLQILSYVAERERASIKLRQRQGIDVMPVINGKRVSRKTGKATGRPAIDFPKDWEKVYNEWQNGNITATAAMQKLGLKRTTFYNLVHRYQNITKKSDT